MWQIKYALAIPKNLGVGVDFQSCSEDNFLTGCPESNIFFEINYGVINIIDAFIF